VKINCPGCGQEREVQSWEYSPYHYACAQKLAQSERKRDLFSELIEGFNALKEEREQWGWQRNGESLTWVNKLRGTENGFTE